LPRAKFTLRTNLAFSYIGTVTAWHSSSGISQSLWRGTRNEITELSQRRRRHLYSAGRPSRWASAHILVIIIMIVDKHNNRQPIKLISKTALIIDAHALDVVYVIGLGYGFNSVLYYVRPSRHLNL